MPSPGSSAVWTGWGSHGMEALGLAGIVFDRPEWVSWAAETAHALGTYMVAGPGALAAQGPAPIPYPQIAYDQSPLVRGLVYLHHTTGRPLYSDLALLAASWLFGNNPALEPLHHGPSGRTFDGVDGDAWGARGHVNYNAGAESTIEGLSMLLALARLKPNGLLQDPRLAQPAAHGPLVLEAESYLKPGFGRIETRRERALAGSRPSGDGYIVMHPGAEASLPLPAPLPAGTYRLRPLSTAGPASRLLPSMSWQVKSSSRHWKLGGMPRGTGSAFPASASWSLVIPARDPPRRGRGPACAGRDRRPPGGDVAQSPPSPARGSGISQHDRRNPALGAAFRRPRRGPALLIRRGGRSRRRRVDRRYDGPRPSLGFGIAGALRRGEDVLKMAAKRVGACLSSPQNGLKCALERLSLAPSHPVRLSAARRPLLPGPPLLGARPRWVFGHPRSRRRLLHPRRPARA